MQTIHLVTGNKHKLAEYRRLLPPELPIEAVSLELDEIQSFDPKVITEDKARRAYEQIKKPVLVEDVAAGLDALNGLPGPFIKFFEQQLGRDVLYKIAPADKSATITCTLAYFDGVSVQFAIGIVKGTVVAPRDMGGFGFDCVFVPAGHTETFAEMGAKQKDHISHRALAVNNLRTLLAP